MENYCISVDWLQVYCKCNLLPVAGECTINSKTYVIEKTDTTTPLWTEVYKITHRDREVAVFCRCPRSSALDKLGSSLKLANRVLYCHGWVSILKELIEVLGLRYVGITRLDLCYDCNRLYGGRDVSSFLMDFFFHQPFCAGHIVRKGSRKVVINGSRSNKGISRISGMRWGSVSSDIGAYCYNKTLELMEVKDKPWIRETWEKNGLISVYKKEEWDELSEKEKEIAIKLGKSEDNIVTPVWRFELSIKGHAKDIIDLNTGELFKLSLDYLESQDKIESLFYTYASRAFDFRISEGQEEIRNYVPLRIFEKQRCVTQKPIHLSLFSDTGRTEKVVLNKLNKMLETYGDLDTGITNSILATMDFVRHVGGCKILKNKMMRESQYLANMKATQFYGVVDVEYYNFLEWTAKYRKDIDAQFSGVVFEDLEAAIADLEARMDSKTCVAPA